MTYLVKPFSLLELAGLASGDRASAVPKEFSLLECSLRIRALCFPPQIIDAAWDFAYDGGSNVVDQYVNYCAEDRCAVRTARPGDGQGMGYGFVTPTPDNGMPTGGARDRFAAAGRGRVCPG